MLETKGKSKISAKEVIAARKLKVAHPELSMQAIKDKLHLKIHTIMVGRLLRGLGLRVCLLEEGIELGWEKVGTERTSGVGRWGGMRTSTFTDCHFPLTLHAVLA